MLEQEEEENRRGFRTERGETNDVHMLDAYLRSAHTCVRICVHIFVHGCARVRMYLSYVYIRIYIYARA